MDSESTTPGFVAPYRFAIIPEWILDTPELESPQVHLFGILVRYGGHVFPSYATLAKRMRRSERSVRRDMAALEKAGAIRRTPRFRPDGGQSSNLYHLAESAPFQFDDDPGEGDTEGQGGVSAGDHPSNESNLERETGTLSGSTSRQAQLALIEGADIVQMARQYGKQAALDEIKKAITDVCGEPTTKSGWSLVNRFATMIRERGDPPESVALRATLMAQEWGPGKVTVASLEKHWGRYDPGRVGRLSQDEIDDYQQQVRDMQFRRKLDDIGEP